ncbi:transcription factor 20 [Labeo rohita]|uniref:transcription factor 20 n=1 Tax=Labeo rohita TaxID=84645 RepID=UPI0021E1D110|nr:transcription factor 20 [Labeo rohita]
MSMPWMNLVLKPMAVGLAPNPSRCSHGWSRSAFPYLQKTAIKTCMLIFQKTSHLPQMQKTQASSSLHRVGLRQHQAVREKLQHRRVGNRRSRGPNKEPNLRSPLSGRKRQRLANRQQAPQREDAENLARLDLHPCFSPQEPEIKLKYANHKEDKKDARPDSFAPYIHMELSSCTIVNFREEDVYSTKKGSQQVVSGVIPKTSCLQLGRVGSDARLQVKHFCCLCGRTGNVEGLGDLHGPYRSSGVQPVCKSDSSPAVQKQELDCSDLDSVYSLEDGASQSVKRQRKENCSEGVEESRVCSEHWIHEDCSIWTAGIFLVKGKLYGLEEAIRLAQETVCSFCHRVGATLGCFFKDCPNKYHFPCALQSDSALNEENFTIRCPKHKNKTSRVSVSRLKNR